MKINFSEECIPKYQFAYNGMAGYSLWASPNTDLLLTLLYSIKYL